MHFVRQLTSYLLGDNYLSGNQIPFLSQPQYTTNDTLVTTLLKPLDPSYSHLPAVLLDQHSLAALPLPFSLSTGLTPLQSLVTPHHHQLSADLVTIRDSSFIAFGDAFFTILGQAASLETIHVFGVPDSSHVHEAPIYIPTAHSLLFSDTSVTGWLWSISLTDHTTRRITTSPPLQNVNGGTYHCSNSNPDSCSAYLTTNGGPAPGIYRCPLGDFTASSTMLNCTVVLNNFRGRKFNSPNDLIFTPSGDILFTDPPYGWFQGWDGVGAPELPVGVYHFNAQNGSVTMLSVGVMDLPNGLALSRDRKTLFVADSSSMQGKPPKLDLTVTRGVWAFDISPSYSTLSNPRMVHFVESGWSDGIRVTESGYLLATVVGGVDVIDVAKGQLLGRINVGGDVIYNLEPVKSEGKEGWWVMTGGEGVYLLKMKERGL